MSNTNPADCLVAAKFAKDTNVQTLLLVKVATCILASILTAVYWRIKGTVWLVHPNARFIYAVHLFWMLELPLTYIPVYSYDYYRMTRDYSDPCNYLMPAPLSIFTRLLPISGLIGQMISMMVLATERAIATISPSEYERITRPRLGIHLTVGALIFQFCLMYFFLIHDVDWRQDLVTYSPLTKETEARFRVLTTIEVLIEVVAIVMIIITLIHSTSRRQLYSELSYKYQVHETCKIAKTLLPIFLCHFVIYTFNSLCLSFDFLVCEDTDVICRKRLLESCGQVQLYSILSPIIMFILLREKKNVVKVQTQDEYFSQMNRAMEARALKYLKDL